ncbi:hypothetical protein WDU94_002406 [Cyamophila willieti]
MVSVFVSTLTLTAIAIDRYFVIMYPFQPRMRLGTCTALIVLIWVVSLLIALPYAYCMTLSKHIENATICDEDWSSEYFQRLQHYEMKENNHLSCYRYLVVSSNPEINFQDSPRRAEKQTQPFSFEGPE